MILGWIYIKPMLPEDFISLKKISDKVASIFQKEEPVNPDEEYKFFYDQSKLKPKTGQELGFEEKFKKEEEIEKERVVIEVFSSEELKRAAAEAKGEEVIRLKGGLYKVNLAISKNLTIIGQGSSTVLTAEDNAKAVISVKESELELENMQIKEARIGLEAYGAKVSVKNIKFSQLSATACYASESELKFRESYIYDSGSAIKAIASQGKIEEAIIKDNQKSGVELRGGSFSIKNNIIIDNNSYGVFADQYAKADIAGNYIDNNVGFNVRIEGEKEIYR